MKTALTDKLAASGASIAEYSGAQTATRFGDVDAEFRALTGGAAVYDLGWRAKLRFTGEDRVRWLNGMVTNNVRDLRPGHGNYNFVLSPQGRIQGDLYIYHRGDHLLGDTELAQLPALLKLFAHYIIMDDVELQDATGALTSIGVQGPQADMVLRAAGLEPACSDPLVVCDQAWDGNPLAITRMANPRHVTYEIWLEPSLAPRLWEALTAAGAQPAGFEALEKFRVLAAIPKYGQDIREKDLPQETGQQSALNFDKGCYVGQEIVERIRSRGAVHRSLSGFVLHAKAERGAKVVGLDKDCNEREIGELTSVATVPLATGPKILGMGIVRGDGLTPGAHVRIGATEAMAENLPFRF